MGVPILGVERDRALEHLQRRGVVLAGRAMVQDLAGEHALVGRHVVGRLALGAIVGRRLDPPGQGRDDRRGHLVLDREDVLELAVVALGPDVPVGLGVDQLHGDAHPVAGLAHAALDHVLDAELRGDVLDPHRLALVHEGGVARDHEQVPKARQRGDDVLGQAVGEELLLGIAAHVDERQDRDRGLVQWPRRRAGRGGAAAAGVLRSSRTTRNTRIGREMFFTLCSPRSSKRDAEPAADLVADRARDADAARLGQLLQARGDVDAVAEDVVVLADHVAEVDADPELDLALAAPTSLLRARHAALDLDRALAPPRRRSGTRPACRRRRS